MRKRGWILLLATLPVWIYIFIGWQQYQDSKHIGGVGLFAFRFSLFALLKFVIPTGAAQLSSPRHLSARRAAQWRNRGTIHGCPRFDFLPGSWVCLVTPSNEVLEGAHPSSASGGKGGLLRSHASTPSSLLCVLSVSSLGSLSPLLFFRNCKLWTVNCRLSLVPP